MQKSIVLKWATLGASFLFACLFIKWYQDSKPADPLITPDGDKLEFVDYTYGNHNVLRERTGPWWKFWEEAKPIFPGQQTNLAITAQSPGPLLMWYTDNSNSRIMAMNTELSPMLVEVSDDQGARVFSPVERVGIMGEGVRYLETFRYASFPRRGRTLIASYFSKSFHEPIGVVRFENPERRVFPEWKPKPLPFSQTDSDLTLTLSQCKLSTATHLFRSTYLASRSMADTEIATTKASIPCLSTEFHAAVSGLNADKEYQLLSAKVSDATGNSCEEYFKSFWVKQRGYDAPKYDVAEENGSDPLKRDFKYGFCIGEKAVRLEVQAIRSPNASPSLANQTQIVNLNPPLDTGAVTFQKINVNGLPVQLALCGIAKNVILDRYNKIETDSPFVVLKVPTASSGLLSVLLRVTDSRGSSLSDGFVLKDMKFKTRHMDDYSLVFERSPSRSNWALSSFSSKAYNPHMGDNGDISFDTYLIFPFQNPPGNGKLAVAIAPNPPKYFDFTAPVANR